MRLPFSHALLAGTFPGIQHFHLGSFSRGRYLKLVRDATVTTWYSTKWETTQMFYVYIYFLQTKTFVEQSSVRIWNTEHFLLSWVLLYTHRTQHRTMSANFPLVFSQGVEKILSGDKTRNFPAIFSHHKSWLFTSVNIFTWGGNVNCLWNICFFAKRKHGLRLFLILQESHPNGLLGPLTKNQLGPHSHTSLDALNCLYFPRLNSAPEKCTVELGHTGFSGRRWAFSHTFVNS